MEDGGVMSSPTLPGCKEGVMVAFKALLYIGDAAGDRYY